VLWILMTSPTFSGVASSQWTSSKAKPGDTVLPDSGVSLGSPLASKYCHA
jgi:hypothetical protein